MDDIMKISQKERKRIETMVLLNINGIKHKEAAQRLGLTARQTKRLLKKYHNTVQKSYLSPRKVFKIMH